MIDWALKNGVYLNNSSNYYPQDNGQAKSTNINLIRIIKRTIEDNQRTWHDKMKLALWVDRVTPKRSIGNSPYVLIYGKESRLPISIELPTLSSIKELEMMEEDLMEVRLIKLMELGETKRKSLKNLEIHHA